MNKRSVCLAGLLVLATLVPAELSAQFGGGFPGGGMRGGSRGGQGGPGKAQRTEKEQPVAKVQDRSAPVFSLLKSFQDDLQLTPEQQSVWQSYADKIMALADDISRERGKGEGIAQMKALQRIDHTVDVARNRLTALEDIGDAAKKLFGRLTPQQQAIADPRLATIVQEVALEASVGVFPERRGR